jgi:hypothetical protein
MAKEGGLGLIIDIITELFLHMLTHEVSHTLQYRL